MKKLFDSSYILRIECQNVVLNKYQIIFEIKKRVQFFKISLGEKILVKEINWVYEIMQGCKYVFVSSYREPLLGFMKMNNI
jgi:hypothetical protein